MVVARMAQPRSVKIGILARSPIVGRVMNEYVPQVTSDKARCRRSRQTKSECCAGWDCDRNNAKQHAHPSRGANQIKWGAMVPFVYLRENRSVVKEHAMQHIFDKGPAKKSDTIDKHPDRGLRRV